MELAISTGHKIGIHIGWHVDHVPHTTRVQEAAYDVDGDGSLDGLNGLESDLIRAKAAINALANGTVPTLVRAPNLDLDHADILPTYARQGLTHVGINIQGDDIPVQNYETITANLQSEVQAKIAAGLQSIIILFHDTRPATSPNLTTTGAGPGYLQTIVDTVENAGNYSAVFNTVQ